MENSGSLDELFRSHINIRDCSYGWTACHAICGASPSLDIRIVETFFNYLKTKELTTQLCMQDNEGDNPLQSAI